MTEYELQLDVKRRMRLMLENEEKVRTLPPPSPPLAARFRVGR